MKTFDIRIFADRFKELRFLQGIGQNDLAIKLGVTNSSISY